MKFSITSIAVVSTLVCNAGFCSDEWIEPQAQSSWSAGIFFQLYESGDSSRDLFLFTTLPGSTFINLQVGDARLEDRDASFDSDNFSGQIGWSVSNEMNLSMRYQYQGQSQQIEIEQYGLQLEWSPYPAFFNLEYARGDVVFFTRDITLPVRDLPDRLQSDMHNTTFSAGYWFDAFSVSASSQRYHYERDLSTLSTSRVVQLLLQPGALAQTGLLVSRQSSISLDYPLTARTLSWHYFITRSAVDNVESRSLQFDWNEQLNRTSNLFLSFNRSDDQKDKWSFGVGLEWNS